MGIKIIKNEKLWMEDHAIQHLQSLENCEGVEDIVGLPDLHDGKVPVGMTVKTRNIIYPMFIGNDIGCGMSLFDTHIKLKKYHHDHFVKKLINTKIIGDYSIGGGNHFAEFQMIDKIYNREMFNQLDIDSKHLFLLVHSGSRNLGEQIYRKYASLNGLKKHTKDFEDYMQLHQEAIDYAHINRMIIANALMDKLGIHYDNQLIIECLHNYIEVEDDAYYHHKGSVSAKHSYAIIAGSRGTYSYIVKCIPKLETLYSLSHGAGRKWPRHLCKGRLVDKYKRKELETTSLGSQVITNQKELLYEEASEAYKDIETIIQVLLDYQCIELIARLKPLLTYKC